MIHDPGNHWHKDDMPFEEPVPGITEPNYNEHPEESNAVSNPVPAYDPDDVPF